MKLLYLLLAVAIMVIATKGSAISDSMEAESDASESEQQLREFDDMPMEKRLFGFLFEYSYSMLYLIKINNLSLLFQKSIHEY